MDKYTKAVRYLTETPEEILEAWHSPNSHPAGCLFSYVGPDPEKFSRYGCLTQIRDCSLERAWLPWLTKAIRADERIPRDEGKITVEDLNIFAQWQRKIDKVRKEEARKGRVSKVSKKV